MPVGCYAVASGMDVGTETSEREFLNILFLYARQALCEVIYLHFSEAYWKLDPKSMSIWHNAVP